MKKFILFIEVMMIGNSVCSYSQSFDYSRYYNQLMQKAQSMGDEINKESQRMSQLAASPTQKDIYVLYCNGQKMGNFPDEWSCKAHINSIKTQLNNYMASIIDGLPAQYRIEGRNAINGYMNRINFTYRRESNPNYRPPSNLTTNNNGINGNGTNDMSDYFHKANQRYQENGGYSPVAKNNKETTDVTNNEQDNNPMQSLVVSNGRDRSEEPKSIADDLTVKPHSTNKTNNADNGYISINGTQVNAQQSTPLKSVTAAALVVNTQQGYETKTAQLDEEDRINQKTVNFQDKLYKKLDAQNYEKNTPLYQKTIDKYNEKGDWEDLSLSEEAGDALAHTAKGIVVGWDKMQNLVVDGSKGQLGKELGAGISSAASSLLELATEGRAGKDEVIYVKDLGGTFSTSVIFQKGGGKQLAEAAFTGNTQTVEDNLNNTQQKVSDATNTYLKQKDIIVSTTNEEEIKDLITNKAEGGINDGRDYLIKKTIRNMPNGDAKQAVSYINGVRTVGGGTVWGFYEHKVESAK